MGKVIVELLALVIGAAVVPLSVVITLVLLLGRAGRLRATAFIAGGITVQVAQGLLFGYLLRGAIKAGGSGAHRFVPFLFLMAGIVLLCSLVFTWRGGSPDVAAKPNWLTKFGNVSALGAFSIGALLAIIKINQWAFILSAVAVIDEAQLGWTRSIIAYIGFVIAANGLLLAPVILSLVAPVRARGLLDTTHRWMVRNNRGITIVISLAFGLWFLWMGIAAWMPEDNRAHHINSGHRPASVAIVYKRLLCA